jgi:hypothetical protein
MFHHSISTDVVLRLGPIRSELQLRGSQFGSEADISAPPPQGPPTSSSKS